MVSVLVSSVVDRRFIGGVMVSVLVSNAVDRRFESRPGQTKDYRIRKRVGLVQSGPHHHLIES